MIDQEGEVLYMVDTGLFFSLVAPIARDYSDVIMLSFYAQADKVTLTIVDDTGCQSRTVHEIGRAHV